MPQMTDEEYREFLAQGTRTAKVATARGQAPARGPDLVRHGRGGSDLHHV